MRRLPQRFLSALRSHGSLEYITGDYIISQHRTAVPSVLSFETEVRLSFFSLRTNDSG